MTPSRAYGLLVLVVLIWAGNFPMAKLGLLELGPITLCAIRAALAAPLFMILTRFTERTLPRFTRVDYWAFVLISLTGLVGTTTVWFWGMKYTSPAVAGILGATTPVAVSLAAAALLQDRLSRWNILGILLTTAAVVLTVSRGSLDVLRTLSFNKGDFIVLASQLVWVVYNLYIRANQSRLPPIAIQAGSYVVSFIVLAPLALFERPWEALATVSWKAIGVLFYTAVLVSLGHIWYYQVVRTVGPGRAAVFLNLMPFAILGLSWALLGEQIHGFHVVGAVVVIAGVVLVTRK
jgi:drug/metabolite transporter (DMT)-like permease